MVDNNKILRLDGIISAIYPGQKFEVEFPNGHRAMGSICGKIKVNNISLFVGDTVSCEISPSNINICRIVYRKRASKKILYDDEDK